MAEVVEGRPGGKAGERCHSAPHLAEVAALERIPRSIADQPCSPRSEPGQMGCQQRGDNVGHGDGPEARLARGRPELRHAAPGPKELAIDAQLAAEEVDPVDGEPKALALP